MCSYYGIFPSFNINLKTEGHVPLPKISKKIPGSDLDPTVCKLFQQVSTAGIKVLKIFCFLEMYFTVI